MSCLEYENLNEFEVKTVRSAKKYFEKRESLYCM